jgi:hypothetical protein
LSNENKKWQPNAEELSPKWDLGGGLDLLCIYFGSLTLHLPNSVQIIHKRRVAMAKAQGNISGAIEWLNKYLEM